MPPPRYTTGVFAKYAASVSSDYSYTQGKPHAFAVMLALLAGELLLLERRLKFLLDPPACESIL